MTVKQVLKPVEFDESQFKGEVDSLRNQVIAGVDQGLSKVNTGEITEEEYEEAASILLHNANMKRGEVIRSRQAAINEKLLDYDRTIAGVDKADPHHLRLFRDGLESLVEAGKRDKNQVIDDYNASLRLGDEMALRCAAVASLELGIDEVINDFSRRDPEFLEVALERKKFGARYASFEGRFTDMMVDYRAIEKPALRRHNVKAGMTAEGQPYYKARLSRRP